MKKIIFLLSICLCSFYSNAQKKPATEKAVGAAEKTNKKSQQISEASNRIKEQAEQVGTNAQNIAKNVKAVIKILEPIFKFHFKKRNKNGGTQNDNAVVINNTEAKNDTKSGSNVPVSTAPPVTNENPVTNTNPQATYDPGIPENDNYNSDGTANWGNQYNVEYGNYLDAFTGTILDGGSAEDKPNSVDLIFLAPNDGQNAYYIITPNFAHDNVSADAFWGSATTDNPVKTWKAVNESEVAATTITGQQFEKIQYNEQLRGAAKQAKGFASFYSSLSKLDGKVFAVKTEMENRTAYALIYVIKQIDRKSVV